MPERSRKQENAFHVDPTLRRLAAERTAAFRELLLACFRSGQLRSEADRKAAKAEAQRAKLHYIAARERHLRAAFARFTDKLADEVSELTNRLPRDTHDWSPEKRAGYETAQYRIRERMRDLSKRALTRWSAEVDAKAINRRHMESVIVRGLAEHDTRKGPNRD